MKNIVRKHGWDKYFLRYPFPYRSCKTEEYEKWLELLGFDIRKIRLLSSDVLFKHDEEFISWIRSAWLPLIRRLPEELQQRFIEEIFERYSGNISLSGSEKNIVIGMTRLVIEAQK